MPYTVIKAERSDGIIIHHLDTKDAEKIIRYADIRAGLSWPTEEAPGYYCILGERYEDFLRFEGIERRGELRLLAEYQYEGVSLSDLFARLTDDLAMLECQSIYTDTEEPFLGHVETFWEFRSKTGAKMGNLTQAPYAANWLLGVSWIQDWIRSRLLSIPETSAAYSQLKSIAKSDLAESPENRFFAVNALRYVVGAFHKYRPTHSHFTPRRGKG
jgi:hypothetical protein